MTRSWLAVGVLVVFAISACGQEAKPAAPKTPQEVVTAYLKAWQAGDVKAMYALTTTYPNDPKAVVDQAEFELLIPKLVRVSKVVSVRPGVEQGARATCSYTVMLSSLPAVADMVDTFKAMAGKEAKPEDDQAGLAAISKLFGALGVFSETVVRREAELTKVEGAWKLGMHYEWPNESWWLPCGFEYPRDSATKAGANLEATTKCAHCNHVLDPQHLTEYAFCPFCGEKLAGSRQTEVQLKTPATPGR